MTSKFEVATVSGRDRPPLYADATVRDAMHQGVVHCAPDTPLTGVARLMAHHRVHAIFVTETGRFDREPDQHVWGVVTDEMVMRSGAMARSRTAGGVATRDVATVKRDETLRNAVGAMLERGSSHAIVVDETAGHPVGVVSTLDVADVIGWGQR
jgi:CBS domain-containing protein